MSILLHTVATVPWLSCKFIMSGSLWGYVLLLYYPLNFKIQILNKTKSNPFAYNSKEIILTSNDTATQFVHNAGL